MSKLIASFSKTQPSRRHFGRLEFIGGLVLTSSSKRFGGWSGLIVGRDGRRLLAVSDTGDWLAGRLVYRNGQLVALTKTRIGPLRALSGRPLSRSRDVDAEAIFPLNGTVRRGRALIAFERNHRIGLFRLTKSGPSRPLRYLKRVSRKYRIRSNKSFESVAVLPAGRYRGRVLAFAENFKLKPHLHTGWLWSRGLSHRPKPLFLLDDKGFNITDMAVIPGGRMLLLERRFRWTEGVRMRLREISSHSVKPGATLTGNILLTADLTYHIDNMEGLSAHTNASGQTVLTMISDDNFNKLLQNTLLLQFILHPKTAAKKVNPSRL